MKFLFIFFAILLFQRPSYSDSISILHGTIDTCKCKKPVFNTSTNIKKNVLKPDSTIVIYQINNNQSYCSSIDSSSRKPLRDLRNYDILPDILLRFIRIVIWPFVVLFLILYFKTQIPFILPFIKSIKYKDFLIELNKDIFETTKKSNEVEDAYYSRIPSEKAKRADLDLAKLDRLSRESPRAVIIEAWIELEDVLRKCAKQHELKESTNIYAIMNQLYRREVLTSEEMQLLTEMRVIRNNVSHIKAFVPEKDAAMDFAVTTMKMLDLLKSKCELK